MWRGPSNSSVDRNTKSNFKQDMIPVSFRDRVTGKVRGSAQVFYLRKDFFISECSLTSHYSSI